MKDAKSCTGFQYHIGAGLCRLNLERECGEGGYEAYEPREARSYTREEFVDAAVSCGWGNKAAAADYMRENPKDVYTTDDLVALRRARPVRYHVYNGHDV